MSEQNDSNLIRNYADGELEGAEAADLERRIELDERLQVQVRFEHLLRQRVDVVMRGRAGAAPEGLAERIRASLTKAAGEPEPEIVVGRVDRTGATAGRGPRARRVGPPRVNMLAVAAALILIAGAVLFSIFGPQIGEGPSLAAETARFVEDLHIRCEADPEMLAKVSPWRARGEAEEQLTAHLGDGPVTVFDLSSLDYEFIGAGKCRVPGPVPSGHFFHERPARGNGDPSMVSLYVVPDHGQYGGQIGDYRLREWFELPGEAGSDDRIHGITNGLAIYFLVCPCHHDLDRLKEAIARGLPEGVQ